MQVHAGPVQSGLSGWTVTYKLPTTDPPTVFLLQHTPPTVAPYILPFQWGNHASMWKAGTIWLRLRSAFGGSICVNGTAGGADQWCVGLMVFTV